MDKLPLSDLAIWAFTEDKRILETQIERLDAEFVQRRRERVLLAREVYSFFFVDRPFLHPLEYLELEEVYLLRPGQIPFYPCIFNKLAAVAPFWVKENFERAYGDLQFAIQIERDVCQELETKLQQLQATSSLLGEFVSTVIMIVPNRNSPFYYLTLLF